MRIITDNHDSRYHWRIVQDCATGADQWAYGAATYADEPACLEAVHRVAELASSARVTQDEHGHWGWTICDHDGQPIAESGPVFPDAAACGLALAEVRRFAAAM